MRSSILFYTGGFTHTMYRELYRCAPERVRFIPSTPALEVGSMKEDIRRRSEWTYRLTVEAKKVALDTMAALGVPVVKARHVQAGGADLIHSAQYLLTNDMPWVVDFEDVTTFVWYRRRLFDTRGCRDKIRTLLGSPRCRAILPWTEAARQSLLNSIGGDALGEKVQVVYPCMRPRLRRERTQSETVNLLFVGTNFYQKGGMETLLAFEQLSGVYPVHLTMVSYVPPEIRERYRNWENITLKARIAPAELEAEYHKADIFVLPVHTDTFGFVFLEAFARGIPCVSTRHFAIPEIITHGKTGLLVDGYESYFDEACLPRYGLPVLNERHPMIRALKAPPKDYVQQLAGALERLIRNPAERTHMGDAAYQEILSGRFSCDRRREAMATVYAEALGG